MRAAAGWMERRPQLGRDVFARPSPGRSPRIAGYMALMEACLAVLEGRAGLGEEVSSFRPPVRDFWTAALARRHIRAELTGRPEGGDLVSFVPAIPDAPERPANLRAAIAGTLLAGLEMAREGEITLHQSLFGGPITVRPGQARPGQLAVYGPASTHSAATTAGGEDDLHRPGPHLSTTSRRQISLLQPLPGGVPVRRLSTNGRIIDLGSGGRVIAARLQDQHARPGLSQAGSDDAARGAGTHHHIIVGCFRLPTIGDLVVAGGKRPLKDARCNKAGNTSAGGKRHQGSTVKLALRGPIYEGLSSFIFNIDQYIVSLTKLKRDTQRRVNSSVV